MTDTPKEAAIGNKAAQDLLDYEKALTATDVANSWNKLERIRLAAPELLKALQQANKLLAELTHTTWITGTDAASIDIRQRIKVAHQIACPAIAKALGEKA